MAYKRSGLDARLDCQVPLERQARPGRCYCYSLQTFIREEVNGICFTFSQKQSDCTAKVAGLIQANKLNQYNIRCLPMLIGYNLANVPNQSKDDLGHMVAMG
ncbi:hypothetical protein LSTR_LSTR002645 [Laodelphax striatellus]|uniref:Uncharacterized protein n=1 Tax=Laodelphax striatellus TaxID=195883 RepID=A0A482X5K4_LAOST|nr:hypothetical protein LSTR_LSTR002645 [Laodelphax striatellus]